MNEKFRRLFCVEAEVLGADFDQLIAGTIAGQRPGRIDARGYGDVKIVWKMVEQKQEALMNGRVLDRVVIIQDQHQRTLLPGKVIDQEDWDCIDRQTLSRF